MLPKVHVHWFRNDLRLYDQPFVEIINPQHLLLPIFILPNNEITEWGFARYSKNRSQWLFQHLIDLNDELSKLGQKLLVFKGEFDEVFRQINKEFEVIKITCQKEWASEERVQENKLIEIYGREKVKFFEEGFLIHPQDLPFEVDELPDIFTQFRKKIEKNLAVKRPYEHAKSWPLLPEISSTLKVHLLELPTKKEPMQGAVPFLGGATEGLKRLKYYLFDTKRASNYKKTRNQLLGPDYSTKFSVWLNCGALTPRIIFHSLQKFEQEVIKNQSTYWIFIELLWRDYFRYIAMKHGEQIFYFRGLKDNKTLCKHQSFQLNQWINGETDDDFVNANMIELKETGFMSNRGRQNVASYWIHDLQQDWRIGAAWFEHCLLDYDVYSNQGNWLYLAGVGNDPRPNRKFNTQLQAETYDPHQKYRLKWLKR